MHTLVVSYHAPTDPDAFDAHYTDVHAPLAAKIPGVRSFTTGHCDSMGADAPAFYMVAELTFDSAADMAAGMGSPEGRAATDDLASFAGAGTTLFHHEVVDRM